TARPRIEAETRCAPAAHAGFRGIGKLLAHPVPEANVSGRAGTRRLADGSLIHLEHAVDAAPTLDAIATAPVGEIGVARCRHSARHVLQQDVTRKRGFA